MPDIVAVDATGALIPTGGPDPTLCRTRAARCTCCCATPSAEFV